MEGKEIGVKDCVGMWWNSRKRECLPLLDVGLFQEETVVVVSIGPASSEPDIRRILCGWNRFLSVIILIYAVFRLIKQKMIQVSINKFLIFI